MLNTNLQAGQSECRDSTLDTKNTGDSLSENVERMSRVDTAWLRMDTEANLMMIVGVWLVEPQFRWPTCASAWRRRC